MWQRGGLSNHLPCFLFFKGPCLSVFYYIFYYVFYVLFYECDLNSQVNFNCITLHFDDHATVQKQEMNIPLTLPLLHSEANMSWQTRREKVRARSWMKVSKCSRQTLTRERNLSSNWSELSMWDAFLIFGTWPYVCACTCGTCVPGFKNVWLRAYSTCTGRGEPVRSAALEWCHSRALSHASGTITRTIITSTMRGVNNGPRKINKNTWIHWQNVCLNSVCCFTCSLICLSRLSNTCQL